MWTNLPLVPISEDREEIFLVQDDNGGLTRTKSDSVVVNTFRRSPTRFHSHTIAYSSRWESSPSQKDKAPVLKTRVLETPSKQKSCVACAGRRSQHPLQTKSHGTSSSPIPSIHKDEQRDLSCILTEALKVAGSLPTTPALSPRPVRCALSSLERIALVAVPQQINET